MATASRDRRPAVPDIVDMLRANLRLRRRVEALTNRIHLAEIDRAGLAAFDSIEDTLIGGLMEALKTEAGHGRQSRRAVATVAGVSSSRHGKR